MGSQGGGARAQGHLPARLRSRHRCLITSEDGTHLTQLLEARTRCMYRRPAFPRRRAGGPGCASLTAPRGMTQWFPPAARPRSRAPASPGRAASAAWPVLWARQPSPRRAAGGRARTACSRPRAAQPRKPDPAPARGALCQRRLTCRRWLLTRCMLSAGLLGRILPQPRTVHKMLVHIVHKMLVRNPGTALSPTAESAPRLTAPDPRAAALWPVPQLAASQPSRGPPKVQGGGGSLCGCRVGLGAGDQSCWTHTATASEPSTQS